MLDKDDERLARNGARGQKAERPSQIPARGVRDILLRTKREAQEDHLDVVAAGVAFYAFLALFPALTAVISIWGLIADPTRVGTELVGLATVIPSEARQMLTEQLRRLAGHSSGALGAGALFSLLLTIWSANKGMSALFEAINIAYDEQDRRGFVKRNALTLLFTVGAMLLVLFAAAAVILAPALLGRIGLSSVCETLVRWLRWPAIALFVMLALALLYRYAPDRRRARWQWVSWGSLLATGLWLLGSATFSLYVSRFGSYNKTYGSVAAIAILLLWMFLSAYVVVLGAELNAEMERQPIQHTPTGPPTPLGERRAFSADTVGETR